MLSLCFAGPTLLLVQKLWPVFGPCKSIVICRDRYDILWWCCAALSDAVQSLQLSGLRVLSSLAAGAAEGELHGEVLVPTALLDRLLALIRAPETHQEVRHTCSLLLLLIHVGALDSMHAL